MMAGQRTCEVDGHTEDRYGAERYWHCSEPGTLDVEGTLMCEGHAGERGYGPKQEEYGFDPHDGLNPTPGGLAWYVVIPFPDREYAERARARIEDAYGYVGSVTVDALPGGQPITPPLAKPPHDGPDCPPHERCNCPRRLEWGATRIMPPGHHWHWATEAHTVGYLAHGAPDTEETKQS